MLNILEEAYLKHLYLTNNEIKQIYNGGNPYNHNEGSLKKNLIAWWRMGDNPLDKYPMIVDSSAKTLIGNDLSPNSNFDSNITGWSDYSSGTVSHETSIVNTGAGALRCTFDGSNYWGGMMTNNISGAATNTFYKCEADIYVPSGFDGGACWLTDGSSFNNATIEGDFKTTNTGISDVWQKVELYFKTTNDATGKLYVRSHTAPSNTKFIIVDNLTVKPVTGGTIGHTRNMLSSNYSGGY